MKKSKTLTFNKETRTISEWAEFLHIDPSTIYSRLKKRLPIEKVLSGTPNHENYLIRKAKMDMENK